MDYFDYIGNTTQGITMFSFSERLLAMQISRHVAGTSIHVSGQSVTVMTASASHGRDSSSSSRSNSPPSQSDVGDETMDICAGGSVIIGDTVGGSITKTTIHSDHVKVKGGGKIVRSKYCKYTNVLCPGEGRLPLFFGRHDRLELKFVSILKETFV